MSHDHTGDVIVTCLAVAETALVAVGAALALGRLRRPRWPVPEPAPPWLTLVSAAVGVHARAGPPRLQVFRL